MIDFKCKQCGNCCKNLLSSINGEICGLYLTEEEAKLFPQNVVYPYVGKMTLIGIKTISYQLGSNNCPLYDNGCTVYDKRPLVCRVFPVTEFGKDGMDVSPMCSFVKDMQFGVEPLDPRSLKLEIEAYLKQLMDILLLSLDKEYIWSLKQGKWIKAN